MEIYVGHSADFDCRGKLYRPIRESHLNNEHNIILPHESSQKPFDSKEYFKNKCGLFVADVSLPSTGLGIELAWADDYGVHVFCVYEKGANVGGSVRSVCQDFLEYSDSAELISGIEEVIDELE